jgi:PucR family transcriptional regulator, purine catabolism regulatory protein
VAITVGELVAIPYLGTRFHAGTGGEHRRIRWAHSCEVPNPWDWFDEGDLLMTNGFSLPEDAGGQVAFVQQLARTGLSGLAIGEGQQAPPLTDDALSFAEGLEFPILYTAYEVPFIALARVVAEANVHEEQRRLVHTVRLYDRLREWMVDGKDSALLVQKLSEEVRCRLYLLDTRRMTSPIPGLTPPPRGLVRAVDELARRDRPLPALTRIGLPGAITLLVPVPSPRETVLVAVPGRGSRSDLALLQHIATIAALLLERMTAAQEETLRLGSELFAHLIEGTLEAGSAAQQIASHNLGGQELVVAAFGSNGEAVTHELHHRLTELDLPHLLLQRDAGVLALFQGSDECLRALRKEVDVGVPVGLSDSFQGVSRVADAAREARWALQAARAGKESFVRYGEDAPLFLPRTLRQAEAAVTRVLGPLMSYDSEHGTELVRSLGIFLSCNRSWQRAAKQLFVHKQTLVYRIRRVEELTNRRLDNTADVADLWLALQAGRSLGSQPVGALSEHHDR